MTLTVARAGISYGFMAFQINVCGASVYSSGGQRRPTVDAPLVEVASIICALPGQSMWSPGDARCKEESGAIIAGWVERHVHEEAQSGSGRMQLGAFLAHGAVVELVGLRGAEALVVGLAHRHCIFAIAVFWRKTGRSPEHDQALSLIHI